jgi:hypothetical protein
MESIYSFLSEGMDQRPAYGFSHRIRASVEKDQITPSPLDYHAEKVNLGSSPHSYTFGHRPRTNYVRDEDTPGPGEYFVSDVPIRTKSGYSFGSRSGTKRPSSHTPGPKYKPEDGGSFQSQRGFSFGHRSQYERRISDTPGPGEYESEPFLFKDTPAYTFGVKNHMRGRNDFFRNITPAPLDYRPEVGTKKCSPSYSFGTKPRGRLFIPNDFDSPGPGEYDTNRTTFRSSEKGFSFGMRVKYFILIIKFVYEFVLIFSFQRSSNKFKIFEKLSEFKVINSFSKFERLIEDFHWNNFHFVLIVQSIELLASNKFKN